jgi:hypothetical protein
MKLPVPSLLLALLLGSSTLAAPPEASPGGSAVDDATRVAVEKVVQKKLLGPLAVKENEHSKFSRARLPPQERRLRLQQAAVDKDGATFVAFAVDSRHGFADSEDAWRADTIVGCVYPGRDEVFIRRGDEVRPAAMLLGKKTKAAPATTCAAGDTGTTTASATSSSSSSSSSTASADG